MLSGQSQPVLLHTLVDFWFLLSVGFAYCTAVGQIVVADWCSVYRTDVMTYQQATVVCVLELHHDVVLMKSPYLSCRPMGVTNTGFSLQAARTQPDCALPRTLGTLRRQQCSSFTNESHTAVTTCITGTKTTQLLLASVSP